MSYVLVNGAVRDAGACADEIINLRKELEKSRANEERLRTLLTLHLREACSIAMIHTLAARIPECGVFGEIAQSLSYVIQEAETPMALHDLIGPATTQSD